MSISLPKVPDTEIMKMLIKANHFLEHSKQHSTMGNEFDIMISIHNLDNAIEYMLRILIRHLEIEEITGKTINTCELAQLLGEIQRFLKDNTDISLSCIQEMKMIRELRNMVQHAMVLPINELNTYLHYGNVFFSKCLTKFFGLNIEDINYSTLIHNEQIKSHLKKAELYIADGKHLESIVSSRNAFDYARFIYFRNSYQRICRAPVFAALKVRDSNLYHYLNEIDNKIELDSFGVDLTKYARYREYIGYIPQEYDADWHGNSILQRDWEKADSVFCYSFVANAILGWQLNEMKSIDSPVSSEHYQFVDKINGMELESLFEEYGCHYIDEDAARLFFVSNNTVNQLREVLMDKTIYFESETYENGVIVHWSRQFVNVNYSDIKLIMNEPAVWEVIIGYSGIPFTAQYMVSEESIDIDICTEEQLLSLGFQKDTAESVSSYREKNLPINTEEKAISIQSILNSDKNFATINASFISNMLIQTLL